MSGFAILITAAYTVQLNVDIKFSAHDACLERLESQIIYSLGSNTTEGPQQDIQNLLRSLIPDGGEP